MPNILDVAVNYGKRKNLDQIIRQAGRLARQANKNGHKLHNLMVSEKDFGLGSRLKQARNEHWDLEDSLLERLFNPYDDSSLRFFDKWNDFYDKCDEKFKVSSKNKTSCFDSFWTEELPKFLPTTDDVQSDPLMYVDHFSKYVSDYAKGLIDGSIEYR